MPGDPIAGYMLAAGWLGQPVRPVPMLLAALVSLLLYCFGLVQNDLADLKEDQRDRPDRPIPSRRISVASARLAESALLLLAAMAVFVLQWSMPPTNEAIWPGAVAPVLVVCISLYNYKLKRVRVIGPLAMGACRGLSLLIGASALANGLLCSPVIAAAAGLTLYVAAVTSVATGETQQRSLGRKRALPIVALGVWGGAVWSYGVSSIGSMVPGYWPWSDLAASALFILVVTITCLCAARVGDVLGHNPEPRLVQRSVGQLIRLLLPMQAAMCLLILWPGIIPAAVFLAAWPLAAAVSKRFYAS